MGNLRGIQITPALRAAIKAVLALPQAEVSSEPKGDGNKKSSTSLPPSPSPSLSLARASNAKEQLSSLMTVKESTSLLQTALNNAAVDAALPLAGVLALQSLIQSSSTDPKTKTQQSQDLEAALQHTKQLSFQKSPPNKSSNKQSNDLKFQKRLERLRLQDEERSYSNLTTNLKTAASLKDDNITVKSMTYAASVGLNMIVAPISFGVFMYFFAGSIFNRLFGMEGPASGDIDIKRVIAGVVSGVFMLFVEMILFVIRSHELDASVRKKSKRKENRANPFGYTQKSMERVYVRDD
ncbi:vacuolar ER assembly factor [Skeletonema marinoi]|uniref:Vacuolar ER assembly factor n=1 Tax=Skeletonema marinoi TaxID=267567 RepID=A0AAD8YCB2_9STRA|nr:vacuolar ER assembly factor [Skeletonema marinoi]